MVKKAFITGITGQDGSYLAELLLNKGYEVHGLIRRVALEEAAPRTSRLERIKDKIKLHAGALESYSRLIDLFDEIKPDECYHLAAQSFVHESFDDCFTTLNTNINGTYHVLSALQKRTPKCKFYFAATSEMFGKAEEMPQTEKTRFHPRSPYGISKVAGFDLTRNYREAYGIFACSGILFNHESPRRGFEFVTRKITQSIARIKKDEGTILELGNLDAKRDWGFAGDYVEAMWLILQQEKPDDYVIATGESHSVREFVEAAFKAADIDIKWDNSEKEIYHGVNIKEKGIDAKTGKVIVTINKTFVRPAEVEYLVGDASKARRVLGWKPKVNFKQLAEMMIKEDLKKLSSNK